jgi:hypothetical protein
LKWQPTMLNQKTAILWFMSNHNHRTISTTTDTTGMSILNTFFFRDAS